MDFEQECFDKIKVGAIFSSYYNAGEQCTKYLILEISGDNLVYQTDNGYRGHLTVSYFLKRLLDHSMQGSHIEKLTKNIRNILDLKHIQYESEQLDEEIIETQKELKQLCEQAMNYAAEVVKLENKIKPEENEHLKKFMEIKQ